MDRSKKIMAAIIGVLVVVCAVSLGFLLGSRTNRTEPAEEPVVTEAVIPEETLPPQTEYIPAIATPEETEPVYELETYTTAAPTTQAPITKAPTTKAPTTKAPTTAAPTTKAPTTAAPTTKAPTTAAPTTTAPAATTTTANRNGPYVLIVYSDGGASDVMGGGRYAAGELVKVSMTPLLGYTFQRWDSSDKSVLADSSSQTYVFQMPASNVSLRAITYTRPLVTVNKGTGIASVSGGRYYSPGEKVTVTAQVASGYTFAGWTSSPSGLSSSSTSYTFTMPSQSVTMTANAKASTYTVRVTVGNGVRSVTGAGSYKTGDKVTLRIVMKDGYTFNRWADLNASYSGEYVTFTMPAKDVSLTASGTEETRYIVSLDRGEGIYSCSGGGSFLPGSTVSVTCVVNQGYTFTGWRSSNTALVRDSSSKTYTFTMPRGNVTLTATAKKDAQYRVTLKQSTGIASVQGGGLYAPGATVTVTATPQKGYAFDVWEAPSPINNGNVRSKTFTFIMPQSDVTLTAYGIQDASRYTVTVRAGNGISYVSGGGTYAPGDSVTVSCSPQDGNSFDRWEINSAVYLSDGRKQTYTFTMPECNVIMTAFGKANTPDNPVFPDEDPVSP